jgi:VIT1/CCC1 family predicted Fe2+/Mn2+ transporter
MLFLAGYGLGRFGRQRPIRTGLAMTGIGVVLVLITLALGG